MNVTFTGKSHRRRVTLGLRASTVLIALLLSACVSFPENFLGPGDPASEPAAATPLQWQATALIETASGHGSGTIIGESVVLTAYHVVDQGITGIEFFGREYKAGKVIWFDRDLDLAMVRVDIPAGYKAAELYCGELPSEELLVAVGHPLSERWVSVEGHLGKNLQAGIGPLLSLDVELSLGNSGGPVFDQSGRLVGIVTAILVPAPVQIIPTASTPSASQYQSGIGLMLPASQFCEQASSRS